MQTQEMTLNYLKYSQNIFAVVCLTMDAQELQCQVNTFTLDNNEKQQTKADASARC